jgi:hypothetical protein
MQKAVWGLPQACILANKLLCKCLAPFGYFECLNTPGRGCIDKNLRKNISPTLKYEVW